MEKSKTIEFLEHLFRDADVPCIDVIGKCQSCGEEVKLTIFKSDMLSPDGNGGMIKGEDNAAPPEFKCSECLERDNGRISPTRCEVFTRVVGYLRPTKAFNPGKKAEFKDRIAYSNAKSLKGMEE